VNDPVTHIQFQKLQKKLANAQLSVSVFKKILHTNIGHLLKPVKSS